MVDLGIDTLNYVEKIVVKNRANCCGGRLRKFHVELLDADKTVVHSQYHDGSDSCIKSNTSSLWYLLPLCNETIIRKKCNTH